MVLKLEGGATGGFICQRNKHLCEFINPRSNHLLRLDNLSLALYYFLIARDANSIDTLSGLAGLP